VLILLCEEFVVRKTQNCLHWDKAIYGLMLLLAAFMMIGCDSPSAATVEDVELAVAEVEATEMAAEEAAVVDEVDEVTEETAVTPTVEPVDECLSCHIDKEMLIATADPEEEVISENEGEG
jgi:outer membrane biosynthesis protein TonB